MGLNICETKTLEKIKLKKSKFFKNKVRLTIDPDAECKITKVSEDLYGIIQKYYFLLFENIIFTKISKDNKPKNYPLIFKGIFIEEEEISTINSAINEYNAKENAKYDKYKKVLGIKISEIVENLKSEIVNQKNFLKKDYLSKNQYNENIKTLIKVYTDIITIKLGNAVHLREDDRNEINNFYNSMIKVFADNIDENP